MKPPLTPDQEEAIRQEKEALEEAIQDAMHRYGFENTDANRIKIASALYKYGDMNQTLLQMVDEVMKKIGSRLT